MSTSPATTATTANAEIAARFHREPSALATDGRTFALVPMFGALDTSARVISPRAFSNGPFVFPDALPAAPTAEGLNRLFETEFRDAAASRVRLFRCQFRTLGSASFAEGRARERAFDFTFASPFPEGAGVPSPDFSGFAEAGANFPAVGEFVLVNAGAAAQPISPVPALCTGSVRFFVAGPENAITSFLDGVDRQPFPRFQGDYGFIHPGAVPYRVSTAVLSPRFDWHDEPGDAPAFAAVRFAAVLPAEFAAGAPTLFGGPEQIP